MIKINNNIAELRKKEGMTQEELAKQLRVSNQAVSKWEAGKCCPDIELLPEIASLFNVSIDELLLGEDFTVCKTASLMDDPVVLRAIEIAQTKKYLTTSVLQRILRIGYDTAKQTIEDLCKSGYLKKDTLATYDRYLYVGGLESDISDDP